MTNLIYFKLKSHQVSIEYNCEVKRIISSLDYEKELANSKSSLQNESENEYSWPVYVELTNGKIYGCDFIISATGVTPAVDVFTKNNKVFDKINLNWD